MFVNSFSADATPSLAVKSGAGPSTAAAPVPAAPASKDPLPPGGTVRDATARVFATRTRAVPNDAALVRLKALLFPPDAAPEPATADGGQTAVARAYAAYGET